MMSFGFNGIGWKGYDAAVCGRIRGFNEPDTEKVWSEFENFVELRRSYLILTEKLNNFLNFGTVKVLQTSVWQVSPKLVIAVNSSVKVEVLSRGNWGLEISLKILFWFLAFQLFLLVGKESLNSEGKAVSHIDALVFRKQNVQMSLRRQ
jgi:hypothetical protein